MNSVIKMSATIGGVALLLTAALTLFFISGRSGNVASTPPQQPLFTNAPASPVAVPDAPSSVLIGDMNNDRKPDLVVGFGRAHSVAVLEGKGNGQFGAALSNTPLDYAPTEMAIGDVNGDGKLDVAVATHDSYGVTLLTGDGKGLLAKTPGSPIVMRQGEHAHTHGLVIADINRDNKSDLITVNSTDNDVSLAFGDGRGNFTRAPQSFPVGPSPYPFGVGDVNNDGWPDIVATATATGPLRRQQLPLSRALTLLLSDGKGGFSTHQLPMRTGEPWFAAIADLNRDGKADIVATHHEINALTVMLGDGRGGFTEASGSPFDFGAALFALTIADVNHDATMDVVATTGNSIRVLLNDGRGGFKQAASIPVGPGAWRLAAADLNNDGALDVVTSNAGANNLSVLLGSSK